jgi:hypothetical protein
MSLPSDADCDPLAWFAPSLIVELRGMFAAESLAAIGIFNVPLTLEIGIELRDSSALHLILPTVSFVPFCRCDYNMPPYTVWQGVIRQIFRQCSADSAMWAAGHRKHGIHLMTIQRVSNQDVGRTCTGC